jgi:hypothetical protein
MPRDTWKHPAAASSNARPAFPRRRRERGDGEKGEKKRRRKGVRWRPNEWAPLGSDLGRRVRWQAGWCLAAGPRAGRKGVWAESEVVSPLKGRKVFPISYSYFSFNSNLNYDSNLNSIQIKSK